MVIKSLRRGCPENTGFKVSHYFPADLADSRFKAKISSQSGNVPPKNLSLWLMILFVSLFGIHKCFLEKHLMIVQLFTTESSWEISVYEALTSQKSEEKQQILFVSPAGTNPISRVTWWKLIVETHRARTGTKRPTIRTPERWKTGLDLYSSYFKLYLFNIFSHYQLKCVKQVLFDVYIFFVKWMFQLYQIYCDFIILSYIFSYI